jgi:hypothetical protein
MHPETDVAAGERIFSRIKPDERAVFRKKIIFLTMNGKKQAQR